MGAMSMGLSKARVSVQREQAVGAVAVPLHNLGPLQDQVPSLVLVVADREVADRAADREADDDAALAAADLLTAVLLLVRASYAPRARGAPSRE